MKTTLYLTQADHFRSPEILQRACECRDDGWKVSWLTMDRKSPQNIHRRFPGWMDLVGSASGLVILDNLYLDDPNGETIRHTQSKKGLNHVARSVFEDLLAGLDEAGTREVILVCEQDEVSEAWGQHLDRLGIPMLKTDSDRYRNWQMTDEHGKPYAFLSGRLRLPANGSRTLQMPFQMPESEVLLALVCEYIQLEYEYWNPADPFEDNKRWSGLMMIYGMLDDEARCELRDDVEVLLDFLGRAEDTMVDLSTGRQRCVREHRDGEVEATA